jgi:phosphatidylserine/phosphatidylglycerophosphate/cardiolipin synthase-like enzyme
MTSERKTVTPVYCTWSYRNLLPPTLRTRFRNLDHFVRELIASAKFRLVIVVPYLSPAGVSSLRSAMAVAVQNGAWIRILTGELNDTEGWNRRALRDLVEGVEGALIRNRIRILTGTQALPILFHAKLIIADGERGYLGSANLTGSGLSKNFEVGTALGMSQAEALDTLVSFFEAQGLIEDCTELALQGRESPA